ncbi:hypothetical protein SK066_14035 [Paenibacillus hunanensis]|uniref:hypothetical protein n=1 Tax=Paenibacillus hunanensis TaxID=539262 RepID=UPI002A6B2E2B|nr:hypothetical protein [Paenibacillus hunanensis]WPP39742.1 hypothetical protein SK066_14035 [Paenibacillus hunanensis]
MHEVVKNSYKVKIASKGDDEDLIKALKIYNDETPPEIKTETNHILHWLESNNNDDFKFLIFIIYLDNMVVGFAEIAYFRKIRTSFIDYLTFKSGYRLNAVFFPSFSLIQNLMDKNGYESDYWVTEINNKKNGEHIDKESSFLRRLLSMENFGVIEFDYFQPALGENNFESFLPAKLHIKSNATTELKELSKNTVINLVKTIYFTYYLNWYQAFMAEKEFEEYQLELEKLFAQVKEGIIKDPVSISVEQRILLTVDDSQKTAGSVPAKSVRSKVIYSFAITTSVFLLLVLVFFVYQFIYKHFGLKEESIATLLSAIITGLTTIVGIYISRKIKS